MDLLLNCPLLRLQVQDGKVGLGINHEISDYRNQKRKNLDLVLCRSTEGGSAGQSKSGKKGARNFAELATSYGIELSPTGQVALASLPELKIATVSSVLLAIEAKAAMTAFQKARPRLKDELTSSFQTIHGDNEHAIAAGLVMVNTSDEFVSTDLNKFTVQHGNAVVSINAQPKGAKLTVDGLRQIQRRSKAGDIGFDALGVILINCRNDGSPIAVTSDPSILPSTDDFFYDRFVHRLATIYTSRWGNL